LLGISIDIFVLSKAIEDIIRLNRIEDARIRLTVSAGEGSQTPDLHSCLKPAIFIIAAKYTAYPPEVYEKGYSAVISSFHRNSQSLLAGIKSTCYLESLLARQEAKNGGADDALLLNEKGFVAETSSSNIFTVRGSTMMTPREECGVLPGITRGAVLEIAPSLSLKTMETDIRLDELQTIDEAFLTNSLMGIMPLTRINGNPVGSGKPGVTTRNLMVAYNNLLIH
jgi:branched-chain amino acid aminotransferase